MRSLKKSESYDQLDKVANVVFHFMSPLEGQKWKSRSNCECQLLHIMKATQQLLHAALGLVMELQF